MVGQSVCRLVRRSVIISYRRTSFYLRIERIDAGLHEHVGQDEVLEAGGASRAPTLVVVLEGFKEVCVGLLKLAFSEKYNVHLEYKSLIFLYVTANPMNHLRKTKYVPT